MCTASRYILNREHLKSFSEGLDVDRKREIECYSYMIGLKKWMTGGAILGVEMSEKSQ